MYSSIWNDQSLLPCTIRTWLLILTWTNHMGSYRHGAMPRHFFAHHLKSMQESWLSALLAIDKVHLGQKGSRLILSQCFAATLNSLKTLNPVTDLSTEHLGRQLDLVSFHQLTLPLIWMGQYPRKTQPSYEAHHAIRCKTSLLLLDSVVLLTFLRK